MSIPPGTTPVWNIPVNDTVEMVLNNGPANKPLQLNSDTSPTAQGYPTQLWNTPSGNQFMTIGFNVGETTDGTDHTGMALSQDVTLKEKTTYRLSFLQSSYNKTIFSTADGKGRVTVTLCSSGGTMTVLTDPQPFTTPSLSPWIKQTAAKFTIPAGAGGIYTLKFSCFDKTSPAFIDDVSLCEQ